MMDDTTTQTPTDDSNVTPAPSMDVPAAEPNLPGDVPATETPTTEVPAAPAAETPVVDDTQM